MREYLEKIRTNGKLYLNNKLFKENAELEFQDNYYTNFFKKGTIKLDNLNAEFINNFRATKYKFKFTDNENRFYQGIITGYQRKSEIYTHSYYLQFILYKNKRHCRFKKCNVQSLIITYKIPFSYVLSRGVKDSFDLNDDYIIKFRKPEFSIKIDNVTINFAEQVYFPTYKKPDKLFSRIITPTIKEEFKIRNKLNSNLNKKERLMTDVMLIISFFLYHKMDWYGYKSELMDKNGRIIEFIENKDYIKFMGDDYLFEDELQDFDKHFKVDIVTNLIQKYIHLIISERNKIKYFIDELTNIKNKNSYKSRLVEALFLIKGLCNYITYKNKIPFPISKGYSIYQEKIKDVIKFYKISYKDVGFTYSNTKKNNRRLWYVTDYRNQIAHSDIRKNFDWQKSGKEYIKVMNLIRRLIFTLIEPNFQNIPYPERVS